MFERFTDRARGAVVLAQEEARSLHHNYIGTEHLLLGLLREGTGVGSRALDRMGIHLDEVRSDVARIVGEGPAIDPLNGDADALHTIGIDLDEVRRRIEETFGPGALERAVREPRRGRRRNRRCATTSPFSGSVPFTPRAKKALQLALREAQRLGHAYIGTEHILLGLVREGDGLAAGILTHRGATSQRIRRVVLEELNGRGDSSGRSA